MYSEARTAPLFYIICIVFPSLLMSRGQCGRPLLAFLLQWGESSQLLAINILAQNVQIHTECHYETRAPKTDMAITMRRLGKIGNQVSDSAHRMPLARTQHKDSARQWRKPYLWESPILKDQMNHKIGAIYHTLLQSHYGILEKNPFKGHLVLKDVLEETLFGLNSSLSHTLTLPGCVPATHLPGTLHRHFFYQIKGLNSKPPLRFLMYYTPCLGTSDL